MLKRLLVEEVREGGRDRGRGKDRGRGGRGAVRGGAQAMKALGQGSENANSSSDKSSDDEESQDNELIQSFNGELPEIVDEDDGSTSADSDRVNDDQENDDVGIGKKHSAPLSHPQTHCQKRRRSGR
ncbi:hypothetical protein K435DRAFT_864037 [Dendrothele bispora CBS 962.96]|uniref:Uncharacterized protein n=1 Tax=Dendrothele bispora (strain CBS 962.96) TaxID=1314807 RepID=A0A4V4HEF1_DENBC|nr:hypothetical protein K435DRAFT_864037 [Dendrothele bispora CBS 962.96]